MGDWAGEGSGADEEGEMELDLEAKVNFPDSTSQEGGVNEQPGWRTAIVLFGRSVA